MKRGQTGIFEGSSTTASSVRAFLPGALPPDPPISMRGALQKAHDAALHALGGLSAVSLMLPDPDVLL